MCRPESQSDERRALVAERKHPRLPGTRGVLAGFPTPGGPVLLPELDIDEGQGRTVRRLGRQRLGGIRNARIFHCRSGAGGCIWFRLAFLLLEPGEVFVVWCLRLSGR